MKRAADLNWDAIARAGDVGALPDRPKVAPATAKRWPRLAALIWGLI